ncbi:unnamed protein product [Phytophthora fragariaefolia]|uniref:Unnamed protein product n=1 Tax=Phytophthora fragariaefolia TaxID=1490495 RepID=A0A9W6UA14_9STRA|nr:unnamed protein product [Phytophthora fragariaefolia]
MLLDCGATTVYVSRRWGGEHQLKTAKFHGKNILIKLGDNQIKEAKLKFQSVKVQLSGLDEAYDFVDPIEEGGPVIATGFQRSVEVKDLSAKRADSGRGAALETNVKPAVEPDRVVVQRETLNVVNGRLEDASTGKGSVIQSVAESLRREGAVGETCLPEKHDIEHRFDVQDPKLEMYRQQWRQSPEQRREVVRWAEDILAHWFSKRDLMFAYYHVRMREEDIKYTAFQAPNGLWEDLVFLVGVRNAPATMHRLTSKLLRGLKNMKSFYDNVYIFSKSRNIEDLLKALRKTLDILCNNKLYVKLATCVFCANEIPCLGNFVGRNGVRMDPDKSI